MNLHNLKKAREAAHLTQSQVAEKLGITSVAYQNYEYGKREPNNEVLCKIADFYNVSADYLLGRDTGEPEPIDKLASEFNMTALEKKILGNYLLLPPDTRDDIMVLLKQSVQETQGNNN